MNGNAMMRLPIPGSEMSKPYRQLVALAVLCSIGGCLLFALAPGVWHRIGHHLFPLQPAKFSNATVADFPLRSGSDGRCLVDQEGKPFMVIADSAWGLVGDLSPMDAEIYFSNRASLGFNSVLIAIAVSDYAGSKVGGYETFDGLPSFAGGTSSTPGPLTKPYEPYWQRVDTMIKLAAKYHLNVIAFPMETGGWLQTMEAAGVDNCHWYGEFIGKRYKDFPNIVWAFGNDYDKTSWSVHSIDAVVIAVAEGIRSQDQNHLVTIELGSPVANQRFGQSSSTDDKRWRHVLGLNWGYTYLPTYATAKLEWQDPSIPIMPYVLGESGYENETWSGVEGTPKTCRRENWCSIIGGGLAGLIYGDYYIWLFFSGGVWQENLNSPGAIQTGYVRAFLEGLNWRDLKPDHSHKFCTAGYGTEFENLASPSTRNASGQSYISVDGYAPAAITGDGTLGVVYVQNSTTLTIDMSKMSGDVTARWYDPTNNTYSSIGEYDHSGMIQFTSPAANSAGDQDFVLLLTSKKAR
ncbi:MAG: DUF4038 domain-containing protein [Verrucomicrobia bacterium]|nr:DUF4038 domain-containing protein [Verrucomicrobiota bacterium]